MRKMVGMVLVWIAMSGSVWAHSKDQHHGPSKDQANKPWSPRKDASGFYGTRAQASFTAVKVSELFANPDKYKDKLVRVEGLIQSVCQVKGCWVMLQEGKQKMRIRFKGYKFFLPINSKGYRIVAVGYARKATISISMLRHYALDRGDVEGAKKINKPQTTVTFTADWVILSKINSDTAPKPTKKSS